MKTKILTIIIFTVLCTILGCNKPRNTESPPIKINFSEPRVVREVSIIHQQVVEETKSIATDVEHVTHNTQQIVERAIQDENYVFTFNVDRMPQFPEQQLFFSANNLCKENTQGQTVVVDFIVEKDGSLTDIRIRGALLSSDGAILDRWSVPESYQEEIVGIVQSMPQWTPAQRRGEAVRSRFTQPIPFRTREDLQD